jgi:Ser/Thr protein kinase RdoA (MazF antagonist)
MAHTHHLTIGDAGLVAEALARARQWLGVAPRSVDDHRDRVIALGDGNLDNVMWDGERCHLIDFEEYGVSDLAYELADVVEHASTRLRGLLDVDRFLAAFELGPVQRDRVREDRRLMACFWLLMLLPGNRGFARNAAGSTEDQARHLLTMLDVETPR